MGNESTVASPPREYINLGAKRSVQLERVYSVFVWDTVAQKVPEAANLDPAKARLSAEYFFEMAPKTIEMTEPFTTRIVPTQNGGKYIESHGSIFKDIRVVGTTGLRPRKGAPNSIPLFSTAPFETLLDPLQNGADFFTEDRTIPESEITGFDDIHFLRNIFRFYSDAKAQGKKYVMVWRNVKDDDYWVAEPVDFKISRNSKNPLTYEYSINLRGISKFDRLLPDDVNDPQSIIGSVSRIYSRVQEYTQALTNSFLVISTQITRIQGAGYATVDLVLGPITSVLNGLRAITSTTQQTMQNLQANTERMVANAWAAKEALGNELDSIPIPGTGRRRPRRDPVTRELNRLIVWGAKILSEATFADSVSNSERERRNRTVGSYAGRVGISPPQVPSTGGSPSFPGNSGSPGALEETRVRSGETIRDIALRLLGDSRRWHELVIINDLRSPYTSDSGDPGPGVLTTGDAILFPASGVGADPTSINPVNSSDNELQSSHRSLTEQAYGRDLRLVSTEELAGVSLADIQVNQQGDLSTIIGIPNVQQAVRIKFATELGQLPAHPFFGARFPIGTKADVSSFNTFRVSTLRTINSDDRVAEVKNLRFVSQGDILSVSADLVLKGARDITTTTFALRRF